MEPLTGGPKICLPYFERLRARAYIYIYIYICANALRDGSFRGCESQPRL